jgi:hypothetical protein
MDHAHAMNRVRSREILSAALSYAIFDRTHGDHFFDPLEITRANHNREVILSELVEELQQPERFDPRPAFAYFPPKNELCDRRLIYLPIKDLTVRYAIAIVFSEQIETEIHPQCFANRRATGSAAQTRFTEEFATGGWARFCRWQSERCDDNLILVRTDISSFYDSISHDYLIDAVCRHLGLPKDCPLIKLLQRLLEIPVIYYSPSTDKIESAITRQGLPIGDGVEGYLANLYLKDVDDAMADVDARYGRYVDDIRIFGNSRTDVLKHLRILQEQLLRKGLNLNSSKTKIAEDAATRADLMSRLHYGETYGEEEDEDAGSTIRKQVDVPFEQFSRTFAELQVLEKGDDAKDFCKFLGAHAQDGRPLIGLPQRENWHVDRLEEIVSKWRGPTKHAAWLLAQTAVYRGVKPAVKQRAREAIMRLLSDAALSSYSRYRLLHHLTKPRPSARGGTFRFVDEFETLHHQRIRELLLDFLEAPAFELNLIALYLLRTSGVSVDELKRLVAAHTKPGCEPVRNALEAASQIPETESGFEESADEPDARPGPY